MTMKYILYLWIWTKINLHKKRIHGTVKQPKTGKEVKNEEWCCNYCGKRFAGKSNLNTHIKNIHEGKREVCETCGKSFSSVNNLKIHIEGVHEKKIKQQCTIRK